MPRPPALSDPDRWVLDLPRGSLCSIGLSPNERVDVNGVSRPDRENEDRVYTCSYQKVEVYIVLDGHDGTRACDLAHRHLPSTLLYHLNSGANLEMAIRSSFVDTENEFFVRVDSLISRKMTLQDQISQKASNSYEAMRMFPNEVDEIQRLDSQISGGSTAVMAVVMDGWQLQVGNVGDSRVLLCYLNEKGQLSTEQLSVDHTTRNEEELKRLERLGLDRGKLQRFHRLGSQQNTRSIGDYCIKGGYRDVDEISHATFQPGTAEPFVGPVRDVSHIQGFLVLMSDGLYDAYEVWSKRLQTVNQDIAALIQRKLDRLEPHNFENVAQMVVDEVKFLFKDTCRKRQDGGRIDDVTLIIRNLNYPLGSAVSKQLPDGMPKRSHPTLSVSSSIPAPSIPPPSSTTIPLTAPVVDPGYRPQFPLQQHPVMSQHLRPGGEGEGGKAMPIHKAVSDKDLPSNFGMSTSPHYSPGEPARLSPQDQSQQSREAPYINVSSRFGPNGEDVHPRSRKDLYVNVSPRPLSDSMLEEKAFQIVDPVVNMAPPPYNPLPPTTSSPPHPNPSQTPPPRKMPSEEEEEDIYGPPTEDIAPTPVNQPNRQLVAGAEEGGEVEEEEGEGEEGSEFETEVEEEGDIEIAADYFHEDVDEGKTEDSTGQMVGDKIVPYINFGTRFPADLSWDDL